MNLSDLVQYNQLISQARSGQRLTAIWLVIPLAFLILILSQLGAVPLILFNMARRTSDETPIADLDAEALNQLAQPQSAWEMALFLGLAFGGIYLLVGLWVRLFEGRSFSSLGLRGGGALKRFGRGFGLGALMFGVAVVPEVMLGLYTIEGGPLLNLSVLGGISLILVGWLIQGPAEELLFRGWVLPVISARYSLWLGIILSSLMFAVAHSLNPGISLLAVANLLLFGLFAALYALWEEGLWGVFGIHAVWNWVQGNIFGLEVSGSRYTTASVYTMQETGPDIFTGGSFGPEGGLMVTLVLSVGIGLLIHLIRRKDVTV